MEEQNQKERTDGSCSDLDKPAMKTEAGKLVRTNTQPKTKQDATCEPPKRANQPRQHKKFVFFLQDMRHRCMCVCVYV